MHVKWDEVQNIACRAKKNEIIILVLKQSSYRTQNPSFSALICKQATHLFWKYNNHLHHEVLCYINTIFLDFLSSFCSHVSESTLCQTSLSYLQARCKFQWKFSP